MRGGLSFALSKQKVQLEDSAAGRGESYNRVAAEAAAFQSAACGGQRRTQSECRTGASQAGSRNWGQLRDQFGPILVPKVGPVLIPKLGPKAVPLFTAIFPFLSALIDILIGRR